MSNAVEETSFLVLETVLVMMVLLEMETVLVTKAGKVPIVNLL